MAWRWLGQENSQPSNTKPKVIPQASGSARDINLIWSLLLIWETRILGGNKNWPSLDEPCKLADRRSHVFSLIIHEMKQRLLLSNFHDRFSRRLKMGSDLASPLTSVRNLVKQKYSGKVCKWKIYHSQSRRYLKLWWKEVATSEGNLK
jgi:hypothetical protein